MRRGVRLGVDVGRARIGVARCDPDGLLATPLETVPRDLGGDAHLRRLVELAAEHDVIEFVVGHPLNLQGRASPSTADAVGLAEALAAVSALPVGRVGERRTTVSAAKQFRATGRRASRNREVIDQAAAVVLLQDAIDRERSSGAAPGVEL